MNLIIHLIECNDSNLTGMLQSQKIYTFKLVSGRDTDKNNPDPHHLQLGLGKGKFSSPDNPFLDLK